MTNNVGLAENQWMTARLSLTDQREEVAIKRLTGMPINGTIDCLSVHRDTRVDHLRTRLEVTE